MIYPVESVFALIFNGDEDAFTKKLTNRTTCYDAVNSAPAFNAVASSILSIMAASNQCNCTESRKGLQNQKESLMHRQ